MDVEDLIRLVRDEPARVLPFVGSGLALEAGAPTPGGLAVALARACGRPIPDRAATLASVTADAEGALGVSAVQECLAAIVSGWRRWPTPALIALCGAPSGIVVTTNYDDAIEVSARSRGLTPVPLLPTDVRVLDAPEPHAVHVVHLHGLPASPSSLVLPGEPTKGLLKDSTFVTFMRTTLARHHVLYLGFGFSDEEEHLRALVQWIGAHVPDPRRHGLVLGARVVDDRPGDMAFFARSGIVDVVSYREDARHTAAERVAIALAPRASEGAARGDARRRPTWVQPVLVRASPGDDSDSLRRRVVSFDFLSGDDDLVAPEQLHEEPATVVVAGPGMGKSTLLEWLPFLSEEAPCARGDLRDFRLSPRGTPPEDAVARLLRPVGDDELLAVELLHEGELVMLLDGLDEVDEVDEELREKAAAGVVAAATRWPQHRWIVASRPTVAAADLQAGGFAAVHILPSRRWARKYLDARAVPAIRVERAMLDGYGLGDLCGVPLFAERLADRLLDEDDELFLPLALLVDEQYEATAREARRHRHATTDLGDWLRSLAIGLELRGRTSARVEELAAVPGHDGLKAEEARRRLADVSLLSDAPGVAAFPLKPLQEGLCADAIVRAADPVAALRQAAVAEVGGVERLRDDMEFTIDLVFEHADRNVRNALRELDEQRWARSVASRGTAADAREALDVLLRWHTDHDVGLEWPGEGLRTPLAAVAEIARRWPDTLEDRRRELEETTRSPSASARAQALAVLGVLAADERTADWLLPRIDDAEPRIAARAAVIAGRLGVAATKAPLTQQLSARDDAVRRAALRALVETFPAERLPELPALVPSGEALRPVAPRLLERMDLDTGIAFVARLPQMDAVGAWLLERLIESAPPEAWSARRVAAVMNACARYAGGVSPDPDLLALVFVRDPDAALDEVRVHRTTDGRYWGAAAQLLALDRLRADVPAIDERPDIREAIEFQLEEEAERCQRTGRARESLAALAASLDRDGLRLDPSAATEPLPLGELGGAHRATLAALVDHWWPVSGFDHESGEDLLAERTRAALQVGAALQPPLAPDRWRALADAHVGARNWRDQELAAPGVSVWLKHTRPDDAATFLSSRVARAGDPEAIAKLVAISGRAAGADELRDAAFDRLERLDPGMRGWASTVGFLLEDGGLDRARALLDLPLPDPVRRGVMDRLAREGDARAQAAVAHEIANDVQRGSRPERPHWRRLAATAEVRTALAELAGAAIAHDASDVLRFAIGSIEAEADDDALQHLEALSASHGGRIGWLELSAVRVARRIATTRVLQRLPDSLQAVAEEFGRVARG